MGSLPKPPKEVPVNRSFDGLAPGFRRPLEAALAELEGEFPSETNRTAERQEFLYGFGRFYDDGRGIVTKAKSALWSWHGFGMGCDIAEKDKDPWVAPPEFWQKVGTVCEKYGLAWGGRWSKPDLPHVQPKNVPVSPTHADRALYAKEGVEAVWRKYGLDT